MKNLLPTWIRKLHWYQQLIVVSFSVVAIALVLQVLTPKPGISTPFSTNHDQSITRFTQVEYVGSSIEVPDELAVGVIQTSSQNIDELRQPLATAYRLAQLNQTTPVWIGPEYSLSENKSQETISLSRNQQTQTLERISQESAKKLAINTVENLYPNLRTTLLENQTKWFLSGYDLTPTTSERAEIVRFVFMPSAENIPIYSFYRFREVFEIWVSSAGLEKLVVSPPFIQISLKERYKSITIEQALQQIEQGLGSIIFSYPKDLTVTPKLSEVEKAVFEEVRLEYRIDAETQKAIPSYRFIGIITTISGDQMEAEVITPAILAN